MLIKIMGAAMILTSAAVLGFMKAEKYRERLRELRNLQVALHMLSSEIRYTATPVPLAFAKIGSRVDKPVSLFFLKCAQLLEENPEEEFSQMWRRTIEEHFSETAMESIDLELLLSISSFLGISDQQHQEKQINLILHQLDQVEKEAFEAMHKNQRMWRYLGVIGGLMLVLMLI